MKDTSSRFVGVILCLLLLGADAYAQSGFYCVLVKSTRVALLPFQNLVEVPDITPEIMSRVKAELVRRSVVIADSQAVADVLRKYRIRNTAELTVQQMQTLSDELDVSYLILGSIDHYRQSENSAEVGLSARLLHIPSVKIEWTESIALHSDDHNTPLELGRTRNVERLANRAVKKLFHTFKYNGSLLIRRVEGVRVIRKASEDFLPCRKLLVLAFGNTTEEHAAGQVMTNQVLNAAMRAGYDVVDPGRAREVMLANNDLTLGECSLNMLQKYKADLGIDFVLTGTVSEYITSQMSEVPDEPFVAFEARLIDANSGNIVWAKTFDRKGDDSAILFGLNSVHGLGSLSNLMAHELVSTIPHVSRKHKIDYSEAPQNAAIINR